jgi:hypothetical protein
MRDSLIARFDASIDECSDDVNASTMAPEPNALP